MAKELIENIDALHTREMGAGRIKNNIALPDIDVVAWCRSIILEKAVLALQACRGCRERVLTSPLFPQGSTSIIKRGKNWYVETDFCILTVNASSYTIITAHRKKVRYGQRTE